MLDTPMAHDYAPHLNKISNTHHKQVCITVRKENLLYFCSYKVSNDVIFIIAQRNLEEPACLCLLDLLYNTKARPK